MHRKIKQTKDDFVSNDNFDPEEAIEADVEKRKFLFKRLLKDYTFTDSDDDPASGQNDVVSTLNQR